jgi:predicted RNase H-like HicB family nuclease
VDRAFGRRGPAPRLPAAGLESRLMTETAQFSDYKTVLYPQEDGSGWVAEIPAISGCYALMPTRGEALVEIERVFRMISEEYSEQGKPLPTDRTELLTRA